MKKFTRKFYNKKLVALGLSAFMGIGLISTGFAAWVMSKDSSTTPSGNVNVAIVTDASAKIVLEAPATYDSEKNSWSLNDSFSFDAPKSDNQGRIRFGGTGEGEDLSIKIEGYLTGNEGVPYNVTAKLHQYPKGIQDAITAGYLAWDGENYIEEVPLDLDEHGKFSMTISFKWGSKFGDQNPSIYYDLEDVLSNVNDEDMNSQMLEFFQVICGLEQKPTSLEGLEAFTGTFSIVLTASPRDSGETVSE